MARKRKSVFGGNCRMSASLAALLTSGERGAALGESRVLAPRAQSAAAAPSYHVFVRCSDPGTESIAGVPLASGAGEVRTAVVPAHKLRDFAADARVERVSAPRKLRPLMDIAGPLVGAPQYIRKNKATGKGVIIGIVDTGIDLAHPAFAGRVLKLWDQEIPGQGPGAGYSKLGSVLSGSAMAASQDLHGHGTHVAGIAGGTGAAYPGIATEADYLIVKTNFQNSAIVEGVRWIFAEAEKLGRPCVVNLSLGGHFDGHDGLDDTSTGISDECGKGRLVVAAAGNEGGDPIHARLDVDSGAVVQFDIKVKPKSSASAAPYFLVNGWYAGGAKCEVRLTSSTGAQTAWQGLLTSDPAAKTYKLGNDQVIISTPDTPAPNGDRQFLAEVSGTSGAVQGGTWKLEVRSKSGGKTAVHAWLLLDPDRPDSAAFAAPVYDTLIGSPGSAEQAITVASYTSRNEWKDLSGTPQAVGLALRQISEFSSPGPLRTGGRKPDVAAPGAMIASCLSAASYVPQEQVIARGYRLMAGTSMASPVITGLLALYLQQHPDATPAAAKRWLKKNSGIPGAAAGKHDIKWGYGLIKV